VDVGFSAHTLSGVNVASLELGLGQLVALGPCRPNDSASRAVMGAAALMQLLIPSPHSVVLLLSGSRDETRHTLEALFTLNAALRASPAVARPLLSQYCEAMSAVAAAASSSALQPAPIAPGGAAGFGRLRRASVGAMRRVQAALSRGGKEDPTAALTASAMLSSSSSGDVTGVVTALVLGGLAAAAGDTTPDTPPSVAGHAAGGTALAPTITAHETLTLDAAARPPARREMTPPSAPTGGADMPTRRRRAVHGRSTAGAVQASSPRGRSRSVVVPEAVQPPPSTAARGRRFSLASMRASVAGGTLGSTKSTRESSDGSGTSSPLAVPGAGEGGGGARDAPDPLCSHGVGGHKRLPEVFTHPPQLHDIAPDLQGRDWQAALTRKVQRGHVWLHQLVFSSAPKATAQTATNPSHFTPSVMLFGVDSSNNTTLVYSSMVAGKQRFPGGAGPVGVPLNVAAVGQLLVKVYHIAEDGDGSAEEGAQRVLLLQFPLHSARLTPPGTPPGTPFVSALHLQGEALGPSAKLQGDLFPPGFSLCLVASGMGADTAAALLEGKCSPLTAAAGLSLPDPVAAGQLPPLTMVCSNSVCTAHVPVSLQQARTAAQGARRRRMGLQPDAEVSDDDDDWGAEDLMEVEHGTPEGDASGDAAASVAGPRRRRRSVTYRAGPTSEQGREGGGADAVSGGGQIRGGEGLLLGSRIERAAGRVAGADVHFFGAVLCPDCGMQLVVSPLLLPVAGIGNTRKLTVEPIEARAAVPVHAYPTSGTFDQEGAGGAEDASLWDLHRRVHDIPSACLCARLLRYAGISVRVVDAMHTVQLVPPRVFSLVCRESYDMAENEGDMMTTLVAISDEIAGALADGSDLEDAHEQLWQAVKARAYGAGMDTEGLSADWSRTWSLVGVVATLQQHADPGDLLLDAVPDEHCSGLQTEDTAGLLQAAVQWVLQLPGGLEACHAAAERAVHGPQWDAVSSALAALKEELVAQLQGQHGIMLMSHALALAKMHMGEVQDVLLGPSDGGAGGYTSEEGAAAAEDSEQARAARRVALVYALPQHTWSEEGLDAGEQSSCVVCCCDFEAGDGVRETGCGHIFHCGCVDPWLLQAGSCPICKAGLAGEDDD